MAVFSIKNNFPWYDSQWLHAYVEAKKLIKHNHLALADEFINTLDVLKPRSDFQVKKQDNIFDLPELHQITDGGSGSTVVS